MAQTRLLVRSPGRTNPHARLTRASRSWTAREPASADVSATPLQPSRASPALTLTGPTPKASTNGMQGP